MIFKSDGIFIETENIDMKEFVTDLVTESVCLVDCLVESHIQSSKSK